MSQDAVLNKYNEGEAKFEEEVSKYLEMNWREVTCQRTVGDGDVSSNNFRTNQFANGLCDYLFSVSGSTNAFIPALSYFCIEVELQKITAVAGDVAVVRPPVLADDITLSNCVGDALFNSCSFRMGGQDVSVAQSFIPQQGALKRRVDQSGAWLYNIGRNASWIDPDFTRRLNVIARDGIYHQDGLVDVNAITPVPIVPAGATTWALTVTAAAAGVYNTGGRVDIAVAGNFNNSGVRVGDFVTLPGAAAAYELRITSIESDTRVNVSFPPGVIYADTAAATGGGVYRKADPNSGRYKQKIIWQPGIGLFNSYSPINGADLKFTLNPNPNYKFAAVQTSQSAQVPGVNYAFNVLNARFYACQVKLAMPMSGISNLPLNEIQVQNKNLTSVQARSSNSLDFIVPPSTYGIAIFFQSNSAGNNTLLPPTTFSSAKNYRPVVNAAPTGPFNLANVQSIQVTYGGVSKTSTLYTSEYNDNTNFLTQRWIESLSYASNWNNPGGAENFTDWASSGYFYYDFSRDKVDSSSYVNVQVVFNSDQEPNTNCFIASFYTRLIRSEYANGQLVQLTSVNA